MKEKILRLSFVVLVVFFSTLNKGRTKQTEPFLDGRIVLRAQNYLFLYNFLKKDTARVQEYWHAIDNGLEKMVLVDTKNQELTVLDFVDTFRLILKTKCSTGRTTPKGKFKILKKKDSRVSRRFGGTMIFWNCITENEAFAIHALKDKSYERNLGRPVSHGCIRIDIFNAKIFYSTVPIGTLVLIE